MKLGVRTIIHVSLAAGLLSVTAFPPVLAAQTNDTATDKVESQAHEVWREIMHNTAAPEKGCFHASYPNTQWEKVECAAPPAYRSARPKFEDRGQQTTGNAYDYVAQAPSGHVISVAAGSFPTVKGVTSEKGVGVAAFNDEGILGTNEYTLQVNTNIVHTAACGSYTNCFAWQQYVISTNTPVSLTSNQLTGKTEVFIEYWLIDYGSSTRATCPSGFINGGADEEGPGVDCIQNTPAVVVYNGQLPITDLASLQLSGSATAGGTDKATATYGTEAYTATVADSYTDISSAWTQAEFNVFGNAGGSEAKFNTGVSLTAKIALTDGSTSAPTCVSPSNDDGTTGETNNLTLGSCTATSGSTPSIQFVESN
jgi:hypothetical protein